MHPIRKYPRTPHVEGSRLQTGDDDLASVPLGQILDTPLVVEEKLDGANAAFSFDAAGTPWLQSRGHYLTGGPRERHFDLFKTWVRAYRIRLFERLGTRYMVYGEWLYARHTIFYDALPHYFVEFDVLDLDEDRFLSTPQRRVLLDGLPLCSAPVLARGTLRELGPLPKLVQRSRFKSPDWRERMLATARAREIDVPRMLGEGDPSDLAEGLYLKEESTESVIRRFKWVRASFLQAVFAAESHWLNRPVLPNLLADGADVFAQEAD